LSQVLTYDIKLPSGNHIAFREPLTKDRQKIVNQLKPEDRYSVEELLAAQCIISINKGSVGDPDPRHRMANWTILDQQFYTRVFLSMFTLDDTKAKEADELAKKLLGGGSSSSDSNSESTEEPT
jgi:hypothetical protein